MHHLKVRCCCCCPVPRERRCALYRPSNGCACYRPSNGCACPGLPANAACRRPCLPSPAPPLLQGHSNITFLQGSYEDRQAVHLVMDLCSGGELFDKIVTKGNYSEKDAAALIRDIVRVVAHCHSMGVIHRRVQMSGWVRWVGAGPTCQQHSTDSPPALCSHLPTSLPISLLEQARQPAHPTTALPVLLTLQGPEAGELPA